MNIKRAYAQHLPNVLRHDDAPNSPNGLLAPLVELLPRPLPYKAFVGVVALAAQDYIVVAPFFADSFLPAPPPNPPLNMIYRERLARWLAPTAPYHLGTLDAFAFLAFNEVATSRTLLPTTKPTSLAIRLTHASKDLTHLVSTRPPLPEIFGNVFYAFHRTMIAYLAR